MNLPPLPLVQKACGIFIEETLPSVLSGKLDLRRMLEFCGWYRQIGITKLFLSGMSDEFFVDLFKSGRAYLHYLETHGDEDKVTSWSAPLLDAIACNDLSGAGEIARKSRLSWNSSEEYEDEFLYMFFLIKRFFLGGSEEDLTSILLQYEASLAGAADARYEICKAFAEADEFALDAALTDLLDQQEADYREEVIAETIYPDDAVTTARLSVEGLALARLAENVGIAMQDNYLLMPSAARQIGRAHHPAVDSWKDISDFYE